VGKKPLYYAPDGDRLLFASELKSLLQDHALKRALNLEALDTYFSLGAVQAPATILLGIHQLPPAHYLVWEGGRTRAAEYWDVPHVARSSGPRRTLGRRPRPPRQRRAGGRS
jgi:asparagine synthase (glutamine-hydrolysing)